MYLKDKTVKDYNEENIIHWTDVKCENISKLTTKAFLSTYTSNHGKQTEHIIIRWDKCIYKIISTYNEFTYWEIENPKERDRIIETKTPPTTHQKFHNCYSK